MAKIIPITEHFQHFSAEMKESFRGDLYGQTRQAWQRFFELQAERRGSQAGWNRLAASSLPQSFLRNPEQVRHDGVPTLPIVAARCRDQVQNHPALTQLAGESFIHAEQRVVFPT